MQSFSHLLTGVSAFELNVDGVTYYKFWNLANTSYEGLLCPYIRLSDSPDTPAYYLDWLIDPEYHLFEGCQCTPVSTTSHF